MSSNENKPKRNNYFESNGEPHESLTLDTNEDGTVAIKFYSYQQAINNETFAKKLHMIEDSLNKEGYYLAGRPIKDGFNAVTGGEIKTNSKDGSLQINTKSNDIRKAVTEYKNAKKELDK